MNEFQERQREFLRKLRREAQLLTWLVYLAFAALVVVLFAAGVWGIARAAGWV